MFVPNFEEPIPGYTGHRQEKMESNKDLQQPTMPRKQIPGKSAIIAFYLYLTSSFLTSGYSGYVPSVKSENVFGLTYGKTSYASNSKQIVKGMDHPPHMRYTSSMQQEFIDHATNVGKVETTAQIVGVVRGDTTFVKPVPPTAVHAFYGADAPQDTLAEQVGAALSQEDHLAMLNQ